MKLSTRAPFDGLLPWLLEEAADVYKERLITTVLGSAARGTATPESDADVVRKTQETVESALKGPLRPVGIEPPLWHDASGPIPGRCDRFLEPVRERVEELAVIPKWLRKERELSFYGDLDLPPTKGCGVDDARWAMEGAGLAVRMVESHLPES